MKRFTPDSCRGRFSTWGLARRSNPGRTAPNEIPDASEYACYGKAPQNEAFGRMRISLSCIWKRRITISQTEAKINSGSAKISARRGAMFTCSSMWGQECESRELLTVSAAGRGHERFPRPKYAGTTRNCLQPRRRLCPVRSERGCASLTRRQPSTLTLWARNSFSTGVMRNTFTRLPAWSALVHSYAIRCWTSLRTRTIAFGHDMLPALLRFRDVRAVGWGA